MKRLPFLAALVIALGGVALWYAWSPPGANDLVSGDEGYYGNMARNVLADPRNSVNPSLWPGGPPGDKPPLYPLLLSVSLRVLGVGERAIRTPSFVLAAITALLLARLVKRATGSAWAGAAGAALLVSLPWFADASRGAAAEIPTATLGVLALSTLTGDPKSRARALAAGALLGLGFLCKLWLVMPFTFACLAVIGTGRRAFACHAGLLGAAAAVGSLHGLSVLAFTPGTTAHWLQMYFGRSLLERAGGGSYVGGWVKHPAFYWAILVHSCALCLPLAVAGIEQCLKRVREPVPRALLVWAAMLALLSAFSVKSGIYAYVVLPAWIALAAVGGSALASGIRPSLPAIAVGVVLSAPWLVPHEAGQRLQTGIWVGAWGGAAACWAFSALRPRWSRAAAVAAVALVVAGGLARESQRLPVRYHRIGMKELAATLQPFVAGAPPGRASFVSPEAPALSFYLFRTGTYWTTPHVPWTAARAGALVEDPSLRCFVVDTTDHLYGGSPDSATMRWLVTSTREVTPRFRERLGRGTPLRVFVR